MLTRQHSSSLQRRRRGAAVPGGPSWQAVGLPGSDGWLARMGRRAPAARAQMMSELQRGAGNRAVGRALARSPDAAGLFGALTESGESLIDRAMCFALEGSVGRDGDNHPRDVQRVRARLKTLGYPTTADEATLVAAIERYQRDVVGLRRPDGRVDPAGQTLAALNAGRAPDPVGAPPVAGTAKPAPTAATPAPPAAAKLESAGPPPDLAALAQRSAPLQAALDGLKRLQTLATAAQASTQALDKAEAKKQGGVRTLGQEWGAERDRLVAEIKAVRKLIDDLKSGSGLSNAELAAVLAYLYRELARVAPYYFQMVNANILEGQGHKAGGRTCNVTSLSMTLEALGKSAKDYKGADLALLPQIAAVMPTRVVTAVDRVEGEEEMAALRLPDFLELLAIAKSLKVDTSVAATDPKKFVEEVEKARNEAAGKILQSDWFDTLIGDFGVEVHNESPWGKRKVGTSDVGWAEALDRVGEINRGSLPGAYKAALEKKVKAEEDRLTEEARTKAAAEGKTLPKKFKPKVGKIELTDEEKAATYASTIDFYNTQRPGKVEADEKRLTEIEDELKTAKGKDKTQLLKERAKLRTEASEGKLDKRLTAIGLHDAATDADKLDKILPRETYAAVVSEALSKHLDAGHQVVGHMYNHYFRVEAVTPEGVVIDDPGSWTRRTYLMKWDEARKLGSFSRFTVVTPR